MEGRKTVLVNFPQSHYLFVGGAIIRGVGLTEWRAFQKVPVGETLALQIF